MPQALDNIHMQHAAGNHLTRLSTLQLNTIVTKSNDKSGVEEMSMRETGSIVESRALLVMCLCQAPLFAQI